MDWNQELEGHNFVVVDVNGEHEITEYFYDDYWVTFELDTIDLQFPFSIMCKDDNDMSFLKVEKL